MEKRNDPKRARAAWIRCIAALLIGVILLAVSGFGVFRLLTAPKALSVDSATLLTGGSGEAAAGAVSKKGDYVQYDIFFLLGNFAEGKRGDTVTEHYAVVPAQGKLVAFVFPQRWFESEETVYQETMDLLSGNSYGIDGYLRVTGTLAEMPEDVSAQMYDWYGKYKDWLGQMGFASDTSDYADMIFDQMVVVDRVGNVSQMWAIILGVAAVLCLLYAVYELARILAKGYGPKTAPVTQVPAAEPAAEIEPEAAAVPAEAETTVDEIMAEFSAAQTEDPDADA